MSDITRFDFHGHPVRIVTDATGEPRWIAADVADVLGYSATGASRCCSKHNAREIPFAAEHAPNAPMDGPLEVTVDAYLPIPSSLSKLKREMAISGEIRPTKKPDADNLAKNLLDCFNGVFWTDDKNIVGLMVRKFYSDRPRWEVEIRQA